MPRNNYIDKRVLCPYYKSMERQLIRCEGIEETAGTHLSFEHNTERAEYQEKYCCKDWQDCRIANMLEMMWEEKS